MVNLVEIVFFIILAAVTGFASANTAKALDFGMDYGHLLDWFRLKKVRKAAEEVGELHTFNDSFQKRSFIENFGERINAIDQLYWIIANKKKSLALWLCDKCMSHRINFGFNILIGAYVCSFFAWYFWVPVLIGFYIISFSFNHYFVK